MILRKLAFVFLGLLGPIQMANAKECLLSHATYREPRSGAVLQFRPLDNEPAALTAQVFSLSVPNTDKSLPADITCRAEIQDRAARSARRRNPATFAPQPTT